MAEAITIIGLVSSILSFVDFGLKIVVEAKNVRDSLHGTTAEIHQLDLIVQDIRKWNNNAKKWLSSGQKLSSDESQILEMVAECERLVAKLKTTIASLQIRPEARSRTWEGMRVVTKSLWKHDEISELQSQLENLTKRLWVNIYGAMQE